jgi:hypothetical protein
MIACTTCGSSEWMAVRPGQDADPGRMKSRVQISATGQVARGCRDRRDRDFLAALGAAAGFASLAGLDAMVRIGPSFAGLPTESRSTPGSKHFKVITFDWPEPPGFVGISCSSGVRPHDVWAEVALRHMCRMVFRKLNLAEHFACNGPPRLLVFRKAVPKR